MNKFSTNNKRFLLKEEEDKTFRRMHAFIHLATKNLKLFIIPRCCYHSLSMIDEYIRTMRDRFQ